MSIDVGPIAQWDRYWDSGSLHSFSQVAGGNYRGSIADFWQERFATLAAGTRVLDVASGNGAVALLALQAADKAGIEISVSAADLASIDPNIKVGDPKLRAELQRVQFYPRTPAEQLPFGDGSIDFVCSQYGLEYSDTNAAVREIARVSSRGAGLALILHHRDSIPLQSTATEIEQLDFVLHGAKLWTHARNLLRSLAERDGAAPRRGRPRVESRQRAVDEALQRIQQEACNAQKPRMLLGPPQYIQEIFSAVGRAPYPRLFELLEESRQRLLANRQRLVDMQRASLDEIGLQRLIDHLENSGFAVTGRGDLHEHDGALLGWRIVASRR